MGHERVVTGPWQLRSVAPELATRYRDLGLWTDDTFAAFLTESARSQPDRRVRIWSRDHPYDGTVGAVHESARRVAGFLAGRGIGPGDVVSYQVPNYVEAIISFWAIALRGAVAVPIVHFYGPKELGYILADGGVRAHLTAGHWGHLDYVAGLEPLAAELTDLETVVVVEPSGPLPSGWVDFAVATDAPATEPAELARTLDPDAPAIVAYTSGTTADPKGVIHTHRSLLAEVSQLGGIQEGPRARPTIIGAPVAHAIGMLGGLLSPLRRDTDIHIADGWDPPLVLDAMLSDDLSAGSGATYFFTSLLDDPGFTDAHRDHMGVIGLGGSPVPAAVGDRARDLGIKVLRSYGSTEVPSITGSRPDDPHAQRAHTDGCPMPGVEVRLVDTDGVEVALGSPGEILARGPERFAGYTDAALTETVLDADGWYHSGDVGVADANGAITITDRLSDIIIRGGENVSAAEVEEELMRVEGVAEVAVVAAPDERLGEHAAVFVRTLPGAAAPDLEMIRKHLESVGLARQKWPEELHVTDDLPRTPSGKIRKVDLRARLRGAD